MNYVHLSVELALTAATLWFWYRAGKFRQSLEVQTMRLQKAKEELTVWTTVADSRLKVIEKLQAAAKVRYQVEAKRVEEDAKKLTGADLATGLAGAVNEALEGDVPGEKASPRVRGFRK